MQRKLKTYGNDMIYNKIKPTDELTQYIDTYWYISNNNSKILIERVLPDGCSDIIFKYDNCISNNPELFVTGEMTKHRLVHIKPNQTYVGIRFKPGSLFPFLQVPMNELTNKDVSLELLQKNLFCHLLEGIKKENCIRNKLHKINNIFLKRLDNIENINSSIEYAIRKIILSNGIISIEDISVETGYSVRHLQRLFKLMVGLTPKMFSRIVRFKTIHTLMRSQSSNKYLDIALNAGYFDQSHFIHEYKDFTGISPTNY